MKVIILYLSGLAYIKKHISAIIGLFLDKSFPI